MSTLGRLLTRGRKKQEIGNAALSTNGPAAVITGGINNKPWPMRPDEAFWPEPPRSEDVLSESSESAAPSAAWWTRRTASTAPTTIEDDDERSLAPTSSSAPAKPKLSLDSHQPVNRKPLPKPKDPIPDDHDDHNLSLNLSNLSLDRSPSAIELPVPNSPLPSPSRSRPTTIPRQKSLAGPIPGAGAGSASSPPKGRYPCLLPGCASISPFPTSAALDRHYKHVHLVSLPFMLYCDRDVCKAKSTIFESEGQFRRHLRFEHNEDIYLVDPEMVGSEEAAAMEGVGKALEGPSLLSSASWEISCRWWRCNGCLRRIVTKESGYWCRNCHKGLEETRKVAREMRRGRIIKEAREAPEELQPTRLLVPDTARGQVDNQSLFSQVSRAQTAAEDMVSIGDYRVRIASTIDFTAEEEYCMPEMVGDDSEVFFREERGELEVPTTPDANESTAIGSATAPSFVETERREQQDDEDTNQSVASSALDNANRLTPDSEEFESQLEASPSSVEQRPGHLQASSDEIKASSGHDIVEDTAHGDELQELPIERDESAYLAPLSPLQRTLSKTTNRTTYDDVSPASPRSRASMSLRLPLDAVTAASSSAMRSTRASSDFDNTGYSVDRLTDAIATLVLRQRSCARLEDLSNPMDALSSVKFCIEELSYMAGGPPPAAAEPDSAASDQVIPIYQAPMDGSDSGHRRQMSSSSSGGGSSSKKRGNGGNSNSGGSGGDSGGEPSDGFGNGNDGDDGRERKRAKSNDGKGKGKENPFRFGCPYRKRNLKRFNIRDHGNCANGFQDMALLKRHILKYHARREPKPFPFKCPRCFLGFSTSDELLRHQRLPVEQMCKSLDRPPLNSIDPEDGISHEVDGVLRGRRTETKVSTWRGLWEILFPGDEFIPQPDFVPPILTEMAELEIAAAEAGIPTVCSKVEEQTAKLIKALGPGIDGDVALAQMRLMSHVVQIEMQQWLQNYKRDISGYPLPAASPAGPSRAGTSPSPGPMTAGPSPGADQQMPPYWQPGFQAHSGAAAPAAAMPMHHGQRAISPRSFVSMAPSMVNSPVISIYDAGGSVSHPPPPPSHMTLPWQQNPHLTAPGVGGMAAYRQVQTQVQGVPFSAATTRSPVQAMEGHGSVEMSVDNDMMNPWSDGGGDAPLFTPLAGGEDFDWARTYPGPGGGYRE